MEADAISDSKDVTLVESPLQDGPPSATGDVGKFGLITKRKAKERRRKERRRIAREAKQEIRRQEEAKIRAREEQRHQDEKLKRMEHDKLCEE